MDKASKADQGRASALERLAAELEKAATNRGNRVGGTNIADEHWVFLLEDRPDHWRVWGINPVIGWHDMLPTSRRAFKSYDIEEVKRFVDELWEVECTTGRSGWWRIRAVKIFARQLTP
jgi:hypothetical protein